MAAESIFLANELRDYIPANKLDGVTSRLSKKLMFRTNAEKRSTELASLRKDLTDAHTHADKLLEILREQNLKISDQTLQIQLLRETTRSGSPRLFDGLTLSTTDAERGEQCAGESNDSLDKEEESVVTEVKQLNADLSEASENMRVNRREYNATMEKINSIKLKLGLERDATLEDVEKKIEQLSQKGQKDISNLKEQLDKERIKCIQLCEQAEELKQEKNTLETKLQNKERALERLQAIKESTKTIAVADEMLRPFYKCKAPQGSVKIGVATTLPWKQHRPLPRINVSTNSHNSNVRSSGNNRSSGVPNNDDSPRDECYEQTCVKCNTQLDSSVYCPGCVRHVLYKK